MNLVFFFMEKDTADCGLSAVQKLQLLFAAKEVHMSCRSF